MMSLVKHKTPFLHASPCHSSRGGEEFLFLGKSYPLEVQNDTCQPLHLRDGFILNAKERSRGRELFTGWYKKERRRK